MSHFTHYLKSALLILVLLGSAICVQGAEDFRVNGIRYSVNGDEATVIGLYGEIVDIEIPCFVTYDDITYTVAAVGNQAFAYRPDLVSVILGDSIKTIGNEVFMNSHNLVSVTLGNNMTTMGYGVFRYCYKLAEVIIPASVTSIGGSVAPGCGCLTRIVVEEGNPVYDSREDCNAIIETATNTIMASCMSTFIPDGITTITSTAFTMCEGLTSIYIPSSVTKLNGNPFIGCSELESIVVDPENTKYDSRDNCNGIVEKSSRTLITGCKNTTIPTSVRTLGHSCFSHLNSLISYEIPSHVTTIGLEAFSTCTNLKTIIIGSGVKVIDGHAFFQCTRLEEVNMDKNLNLTTIGSDAFAVCSSLPEITLPSTVTTVGNDAFILCYKLRTVKSLRRTPPTASGNYCFSDSTRQLGTLYVPLFGLEAYRNAEVWKDFANIVALPTQFKVDDLYYLSSSDSTASVTMNPVEQYSNYNAYQGDIVIPDTVSYQGYHFTITAVGRNAFDGSDITSVFIPKSVTTIEAEAFQGCTSLKQVTFSKNVNFIGQKAFNYCNALEEVTCKGKVAPYMEDKNCFTYQAYANAWLLFPWDAYDAYIDTSRYTWINFIHRERYIAPGDPDGDGKLSIKDVTLLIDILLGSGGIGWYTNGADVDGDGITTIKDVTMLIDLILAGDD